MKILFLTKYKNKTTWYELWKRDLTSHAEILFCGKNYPESKPLEETVSSFHPDILVTAGLDAQKYMTGWNNISLPKVCLLLDFNILHQNDPEVKRQGSIFYPKYIELLQNYKFDVIFSFFSGITEFLPKYNIEILNLPFSREYFFDDFQIRDIDIMTSAGTDIRFYPHRKEINKFVKTIKDIRILTKYLKFEDYAKYLRRAKIFVNSGNRYVNNTVSLKYLEAMASGTLLLTTKPVNLDQYEFLENRHLTIYSTFNELEEKIGYYLNNESVRKRIVEEAKWFVMNRFNNNINTLRFIKELQCLIK